MKGETFTPLCCPGPDKVAEFQKAALDAKTKGAHPTDWKLEEGAAAKVADALHAFRTTSDMVERLRNVLKEYVGTRR